MPHLPLLRFPVRLRVGKHARLELSASDVVSVRHLAGLGEKPSEWGSDALTAVDRLGAYPWFRRLPSHGRSPFRSCPHLVLLSYELFIWYNAPLSKGLELNTRDFHLIRSRPCWAYLQRSARSRWFGDRKDPSSHSINSVVRRVERYLFRWNDC